MMSSTATFLIIKYCASSINADIPNPIMADLFQLASRNNNAGKKPIGTNIAKFPKKLIRVAKKKTGVLNKSSI